MVVAEELGVLGSWELELALSPLHTLPTSSVLQDDKPAAVAARCAVLCWLHSLKDSAARLWGTPCLALLFGRPSSTTLLQH